MKSISAALFTETLKVWKSRILWLTLAFFAFIPMMMGLLIYVSGHPEIAAKLGLIGTKASLFGKSDWTAYFYLLKQSTASVEIIGFGFVLSWIFGREYSDRTVKDLLALPVSRRCLVLSKFIVAAGWCAILTLVLLFVGLLTGRLLHISGWSAQMAHINMQRILVSSLFNIFISLPVAFFASWGRGYMLPMGFVLLTMILAQFTGLVGLAPYFPWAIPGLYGIAIPAAGMHPVIASYVILFTTSLVGTLATFSWWNRADQF